MYSFDRNLLLIKENFTFDIFCFGLGANATNFKFMILNRKNHRRQRMAIKTITVKESNEVILLGITIDNTLVFEKTF